MPATLPDHIPAGLPRSDGWFGRWLGRCLLRLGGWRVVGQVPDEPKLVLIVAPHSTFWDAIWGLAAKLALGARVSFMAKQEAFRGPVGWVLRRLGGLPINRSSPGRVVADMAQRFREADSLWLGIAPEGTRKPVERWKSGFWRIAHAADVPVLCVYLHYPEKVLGLGEVFRTSADMDADLARMRAFYAPFRGKHRGV